MAIRILTACAIAALLLTTPVFAQSNIQQQLSQARAELSAAQAAQSAASSVPNVDFRDNWNETQATHHDKQAQIRQEISNLERNEPNNTAKLNDARGRLAADQQIEREAYESWRNTKEKFDNRKRDIQDANARVAAAQERVTQLEKAAAGAPSTPEPPKTEAAAEPPAPAEKPQGAAVRPGTEADYADVIIETFCAEQGRAYRAAKKAGRKEGQAWDGFINGPLDEFEALRACIDGVGIALRHLDQPPQANPTTSSDDDAAKKAAAETAAAEAEALEKLKKIAQEAFEELKAKKISELKEKIAERDRLKQTLAGPLDELRKRWGKDADDKIRKLAEGTEADQQKLMMALLGIDIGDNGNTTNARPNVGTNPLLMALLQQQGGGTFGAPPVGGGGGGQGGAGTGGGGTGAGGTGGGNAGGGGGGTGQPGGTQPPKPPNTGEIKATSLGRVSGMGGGSNCDPKPAGGGAMFTDHALSGNVNANFSPNCPDGPKTPPANTQQQAAPAPQPTPAQPVVPTGAATGGGDYASLPKTDPTPAGTWAAPEAPPVQAAAAPPPAAGNWTAPAAPPVQLAAISPPAGNWTPPPPAPEGHIPAPAGRWSAPSAYTPPPQQQHNAAPQVASHAPMQQMAEPAKKPACHDPPTSPRGRCVKANGGHCDAAKGIWVSPNDSVKKKCAPLSAQPDRPATHEPSYAPVAALPEQQSHVPRSSHSSAPRQHSAAAIRNTASHLRPQRAPQRVAHRSYTPRAMGYSSRSGGRRRH